MAQTGLTFVIATFCLLIAACSPVHAPSGGSDPHAVQAAAAGKPTCLKTTAIQNDLGARATNTMRRRAGLQPVRPNALLASVASRHACDMARRGLMTHVGTGTPGPAARVKAVGYRPTLTAENIAAGPYSLGQVLAAWNASKGHRTNIMIPQVRDYGIGQAIGADGRTRFWTAIYAAPK